MTDPEMYQSADEQFASGVAAEAHAAAAYRARQRSGIEREFADRDALESTLQTKAQVWRDEVASRVEGYRTKRSKKRLAGEFSMKLDFSSPVYPSPTEDFRHTQAAAPAEEKGMEALSCAPAEPFESATSGEPVQQYAAVAEPLIQEAFEAEETPAQLEPTAQPERKAPRKIIEFPRPTIFPEFEDPNALAEAVWDKPRILDVPEEVPTEPPLFSDVELAPAMEEEERIEFQLPLQVAPIPQRVTAAMLDAALVIAGTVLFGAILWRSGVALPHAKPLLGAAAAIPVLFWAVYQYLFVVHAATTPGMQMCGIRMSTFEGTVVRRHLRRIRALVVVLSAVSLGMGFLWAIFDEDTLCWHDKMTGTYLTLK